MREVSIRLESSEKRLTEREEWLSFLYTTRTFPLPPKKLKRVRKRKQR